MTYGEEMIDVTTHLARLRSDLVDAIAADQLRSRRRRRARFVALAVAAAIAIGGTAVAATTGLFSPAPDSVKHEFTGLGDRGVDVSKAVKIGVIDDHAAYAAPTEAGGFCLYFASSPRSGPTGGSCVPSGERVDGVAFNVSLGSDGGFVFGRATAGNATTVDIDIPNGGGTLTAPVAEEGFFLAKLTRRALVALTGAAAPSDGQPINGFDPSLIDAVAVTAKDAQGNVVAHATAPSVPEDPNLPVTTGSELPSNGG